MHHQPTEARVSVDEAWPAWLKAEFAANAIRARGYQRVTEGRALVKEAAVVGSSADALLAQLAAAEREPPKVRRFAESERVRAKVLKARGEALIDHGTRALLHGDKLKEDVKPSYRR